MEWLAQKETKKALEWLHEAREKGADWRVLTESVLEMLHQELMGRFGVITERTKEAKSEITKLSVEELKKLIRLFSKADQELKTAVIPALPLELAIVEWCEGGGD